MNKNNNKGIFLHVMLLFSSLLVFSGVSHAEPNPFLPPAERVVQKDNFDMGDLLNCGSNDFDIMQNEFDVDVSPKSLKYIGSMNGKSIYFDEDRQINIYKD